MNLIFRGLILFFLLFTLSPVALKAQEWEVGASVGTSGYMGEYNPKNILKFNSLSGSVGVKYNFNPTWGVRGNLSMMGIKGDGKHLDDPTLVNRDFKKTLKELSLLAEFNFFKFEPNKRKAAYTPYVFAGIGGLMFDYSNTTQFKPVIPFGVGFKYNLKGNLTLDSHLSYRLAGTDVLDDNFGGQPWDNNILKNINNADSYMTFQIGITYTFFKQGCPTW